MVDNDILAVIQQVQLSVHVAERFRSKALAVFDLLVYHQFEFREHSLTVKRCTELLEEIIDEVRAALLIRGGLEKVLHEQALVAGRSNLGYENHIIRVNNGLIFI